MIIHSPIISGSLTFADGGTLTLPPGSVYSGSFSGSYQGDSFSGGVFTGDGSGLTFNGTGIISSSAQIDSDLFNIDGLVSTSAQISAFNTFLEINGDGVVSGSSQITLEELTSGSNATDFITEGSTNLYYTDARVKTKLTSEDVVSGSATQVRTFLNVEDGADVTDSTNVVSSLVGATAISAGNKTTIQSNLDVDPSGTDNSTDVTLAGSYDYITISGQVITRNQITNDDLAGSIANAKLANSTITINGNSTALGGSYSVTAADVGLGNVTNESKATMFTNAALTGAPTAPTQTGTDDSTKIATTAFVQDRIDTIIGTAGSTLDTLGELSASLSDDQDALTSLTTTVGTKLAKASNLSDLTNTSTARTNLGVAIGTDVQAYNATLAAVAGGTYTGDDSITTVGTISTGTWQGSAISTTYIQNTSGTNTGDEPDASTTVKGIVELATTAETTTGTDTTRAVTPDGLKDGYQGSTNVTTLGTITTGVWNGTAIANANLANSTISGISLGSNLASLSAGTGISLTAYNGSTARTISIGQSVGTSDTVQFGKVGVGTAADATYELKVSGDIGATGDIVAYISSDERLKDNIELISNPIEKVQSLRGVTWEWNDNASEAAKQSPNVGVIAQEVEKVLPQLVHDRESGYKGVDYAKLTGLLIEAIKDQQKQIDDLKSKLG